VNLARPRQADGLLLDAAEDDRNWFIIIGRDVDAVSVFDFLDQLGTSARKVVPRPRGQPTLVRDEGCGIRRAQDLRPEFVHERTQGRDLIVRRKSGARSTASRQWNRFTSILHAPDSLLKYGPEIPDRLVLGRARGNEGEVLLDTGVRNVIDTRMACLDPIVLESGLARSMVLRDQLSEERHPRHCGTPRPIDFSARIRPRGEGASGRTRGRGRRRCP
jgi:hypothetical protein